MMINQSLKPRVGTCGWCGRRNTDRRYAVYTADGCLRTAEVCLRCLEEYRRGLEWEQRKENSECK